MSKKFKFRRILESSYIRADSKEEALERYVQGEVSNWYTVFTEIEEKNDE